MLLDTSLIAMIVAGLVLAYIFGMIANRVKVPPLVGYLVAGVVVGQFAPDVAGGHELANQLVEIGAVLLMFGVGLNFSLKDLLSVRGLVIPASLGQLALITMLGMALGLILGWGSGGALIFGLALSGTSSVVLLKAMEDRRLIETERGRLVNSWLVVGNAAMVLALVLVPAFAQLAGPQAGVHDPLVALVERMIGAPVGLWGVLGLTVVKLVAFVGFMVIAGRRIVPWALHTTAHAGSRELFRLAVLAIALGMALASSVLFGVSLAVGAFFAGMILSESELSHRAALETLPLRDAFAVLFFVAVGMVFEPQIVVAHPISVLATVLIIIGGKAVAAFFILRLAGRPISTALTVSASVAQIGEFAFVLASLAVGLTLLPEDGRNLILAGTLISVLLNPLMFWAMERLKPILEARGGVAKTALEPDMDRVEPDAGQIEGAASEDGAAAPKAHDEESPSKQTGHTVLVGFGRVGRVVGEGLHKTGAGLVVIEDADSSVALARRLGIETVMGTAAATKVLELANIAQAKSLLIAIPNAFEAGQVSQQGRKLNPKLRIIARAHSDEEEEYLHQQGADTVIVGEREIGLGMVAWLKGERDAAAASEPEEQVPLAEDAVLVETASEAAPIAVEAAAVLPAEPIMVTPEPEPIPEAAIDAAEVLTPAKDVEPTQPAADQVAAEEAVASTDAVMEPSEAAPAPEAPSVVPPVIPEPKG